MAKGKPASKIAKGANGRKNHGPKRHLNHDVYPKALRMMFGRCGVLDKYSSFDSFCLSMQARGVRADMGLMWKAFREIPVNDKNGKPLPDARARLNDFFRNAKQISVEVMQNQKKEAKAE